MQARLFVPATLNLARAPFLMLSVLVVALGGAMASFELHASGETLDRSLFMLVLLGAVSAHVAVNALNEYFDFKSGLDELTNRTPFSGGSGFLPQYPKFVSYAKWLGMAALLLTVGIGLYLITLTGWGLLPFGLVGVVLILAYTPWINKYPYLCLLAPGVGFGPLMLLGTFYVLTGGISPAAVAASIIVLLLVNNLLLLNQFPDVEADRSVGRKHFPIVIGRFPSAWIYTTSTAIAFAMMMLCWALGLFPQGTAWVFLTVPLMVLLTGKVLRDANNVPELIKVLGLNVLMVLAVPGLLAVGFVTG
ncbi:MAG: prenyltransferase [bacterium]